MQDNGIKSLSNNSYLINPESKKPKRYYHGVNLIGIWKLILLDTEVIIKVILGDRFENQKGALTVRCISCGAKTSFGTTTDVTDLGSCLVIVRNVPSHKCSECNEIIYTADVIKHLEEIAKTAELAMNEITIVNYKNLAA